MLKNFTRRLIRFQTNRIEMVSCLDNRVVGITFMQMSGSI